MIILDTHVLVWWVSSPNELSPKARSAIDYADRIGLSPITCWEIATKVVRGKLKIDRDLRIWMKQVLSLPRLELVPMTEEIAIAAAELGNQGFHGDPADRIIAASAICAGSSLVTKDSSIRRSRVVDTIW